MPVGPINLTAVIPVMVGISVFLVPVTVRFDARPRGRPAEPTRQMPTP